MKTNELTGSALDWAVAKCEGFDTRNNCVVEFSDGVSTFEFVCNADDGDHAREQLLDAEPTAEFLSAAWIDKFNPSTDWAQGGLIIEREGISLYLDTNNIWQANMFDGNPGVFGVGVEGETALIAAMRCFVASKMGDEVELPDVPKNGD